MIDITPNDERWYIIDDLPNENWKPIPYAEDCYDCSNYSRVKSNIRNGTSLNGRILKPQLKKDGYYQVQLKVHGKTFYHRVNRIVAITFIPNPENKPLVDHKDNNPLNNRLDNLQWFTESENISKYIRECYDGKYKGRGRIFPKKVSVYDGTNVNVYDSLVKCAIAIFGDKHKRAGISKACKCGKPYYGLHFSYVDEEVVKK